jgi:hypothetical protein
MARLVCSLLTVCLGGVVFFSLASVLEGLGFRVLPRVGVWGFEFRGFENFEDVVFVVE